jgi:hypothetical protein
MTPPLLQQFDGLRFTTMTSIIVLRQSDGGNDPTPPPEVPRFEVYYVIVVNLKPSNCWRRGGVIDTIALS